MPFDSLACDDNNPLDKSQKSYKDTECNEDGAQYYSKHFRRSRWRLTEWKFEYAQSFKYKWKMNLKKLIQIKLLFTKLKITLSFKDIYY